MSIKVLHVNVDDQGYGGVYSLVRSIIASKPEGIDFDIACFEPFESQENVDELASYGCTVYYVGRVGSKVIKQFAYFSKLKKLIEERNYDVVHIHSDVANKMLIAVKAAQAAKAPKVILHSHASGTEGRFQALRRLAHRASTRFLPLSSVELVACSARAGSWMFPRADTGNVVIIHNGIDTGRFRFNSEIRKTTRTKLDVGSSLVVGHVGRFMRVKNHRYLVEIFSRIITEHPDSRLLLVGEGPLEDEVRRHLETLGLLDKAIFYGLSDDVASLYMAMDVFLLPSNHEGLGMVAVEAQTASLPAILADCVPREVMISDKVVFLPTTKEAIGEWAQRATFLGKTSRVDTFDEEVTYTFDLQYTVDSLTNIYKALASGYTR